ncbi:sensor histidine kinase [Rhizobiaceae bacterium n13]|uniref:histidine kinase n=1 Tax=Ferirhizobium litorale TaxID=2927786 RepID=A0AAE3U3H8_9HYPH|nr:ATP-binding protein [Fererhizobium litorale]MDI7861684.1 sensor histidine kinase [Fererhizobium litorale]MDI7921974.1 sensor histidine kinase [Fererhizobium litorale]
MTRRLIFALTGVVTAFWLLATGLGVLVMQDEFNEIFDSALKETAGRLTPLVVDHLYRLDDLGTPRQLDPVPLASADDYIFFQVRDASGKVLLHSHDITAKAFDAPLQRGFHDTREYRVYTAAAVSGTIFIQVADPRWHRREATVEGGMALLLPLLILLPASIFAIRFIVRRMVSPVDTLRQAIASKDSGNMAPIAETMLPRELQPIAHSVNRLLGRLRSALEAEREFTSNSAHELRTPIAGALAQTQRLIEDLPEGEPMQRARKVEASLGKLSRLTEKLLQLSRAEAGIGSTETTTDLLPALRAVIEDARRISTGPSRLALSIVAGATLERAVDADAFAIAIRNLVENALVHSPPGSPVNIRVASDGTIHITNQGPVASREELAAITRRFARGRTNAPGSGLGLPIVVKLVQQMNGTIEFLSPIPGKTEGFEVRVSL